MADRENLHRVLAQAIIKYLPDCNSALTARKSITRDDLAVQFGVRYDTIITLADWTAAIEKARPTTQQRRPDPRVTQAIYRIEQMTNSPFFYRLDAATREHWLAQLAQYKALL